MALFKIEDLSFKYPDRKEVILKQINLEIEEGSFVTICGKSGCGKTTLLRHLKPTLTPYGFRKGKIYFKGQPIEDLDQRSQTMKLGYVLQNPEQQIVTDKVWHELAFGLESLGYDNQTIRLRVAEMASFFGITHWFHRSIDKLSGGQKQILNLAAIMAMQPEVIILDEPTAQLDPIAAKNFIEMLRRIHTELGITIILSEHRLEEVLPITDELIVMEQGRKLVQETVAKAGRYLAESQHELFKAMPTAMQVAWYVTRQQEMANSVITVREGRNWLRHWLQTKELALKEKVECSERVDDASLSKRLDKGHFYKGNAYKDDFCKGSLKRSTQEQEVLLQLKEVYFKYDKTSEDILKGVSYCIKKGNFYAIVGGNGTGKTTTLSVIAGLYKPYRGKVKWYDKEIKVAMLPQNPQELFECSTVREELLEMEREEKVQSIAELLAITELLETHPYDLSGGQMQCVALAKILLLEPEVLLLDEPTKGIDADFKEKLGELFTSLKARGMTLIMVSHDLDFCARYSDECALFFDGQVISSGSPKDFFSENSFYTTTANRMSRGIIDGCITSEEVISACQTHIMKMSSNA